MQKITLHLFLLFAFCILLHRSTAAVDHRFKRFITWPTSRRPNVVQIIAGVGIPVDLELEAVTMGFVFKAGFVLPNNVSQLEHNLADPFDLYTQPIAPPQKRSVDAVRSEGDEGDDEIELRDRSHLATMRWNVYKGLAKYAESKGLPGRMCILRSICESAQAPVDSNSILGELVHVIMTPSLTNDAVDNHSDYEYFHAEKLGRDGAPCNRIFDECAVSILDQFSSLYTTFR